MESSLLFCDCLDLSYCWVLDISEFSCILYPQCCELLSPPSAWHLIQGCCATSLFQLFFNFGLYFSWLNISGIKLGRSVFCFQVYIILFLLKGLHISPSLTDFRKASTPDKAVMIFRDTRYLLIPCHLWDIQLLRTSGGETVNMVHRTRH